MKLNVDEQAAVADAEATQPGSTDHEAAKAYWASCTDTFVADAAYYDRSERLLRDDVLPKLDGVRRALDVGCGNGRFTRVIGEAARSVLGIDIAPALIEQAVEAASVAGLTRVQFECRDAERPLPEGAYDLVSCMGVLSTLVDDTAFVRLVQQLAERTRAGGWLITKDTVCRSSDRVQRTARYPIHYRQIDAYRAAFEHAGLVPVREIELARWTAEQINRLWVWRKPDSAVPAQPGQPVVLEVADGLEPARGETAATPVAQPAASVPSVESAAADEPPGLPTQTTAAASGTDASPSLQELADHQERQSEVLLNIGQFLCHLGERLQAIETRLNAPAPAGAMPAGLAERLDRLEATLHWSTRQPRGRVDGLIRVAFLVHHAAAWPAVRGIVDAMRDDPQFEPVVVSIPHRFPMLARLGGEQEVHDMLEAQGYAHVRVPDAQADQALERLKQLNPQVVFRQAPWDADVPACLHAQHLAFTRLCYVPYGYLTARIEQHQFDQPYHRLSWRIFCPDDAHRELYARHNQLGGSNCRVTGFPKFDHLLQHVGGVGHWPVAQTRLGRFRLLWAPHFSYTGPWLRFGVFDRIAAAMLELAATRQDLEIVLRPHPAMREAMASAAGDTFLGRFRDRWAQLPNVGLSLEQEYADLFAASQAMLTDGLSFLSEYQFFDKPLVFFEREDNVGFNAAGAQLLQGLYRVPDMDAFTALLGRLKAGREDPAIVQARRAVVAAMHPFPREAARRIVDVIRREIDQP